MRRVAAALIAAAAVALSIAPGPATAAGVLLKDCTGRAGESGGRSRSALPRSSGCSTRRSPGRGLRSSITAARYRGPVKLGLSQLIDPRLIPLVDSTREFYAKRGVGRGPSGWSELKSIRDAAKPPTPSSPPAAVEVVGHGDRTVPVRIHLPTSTAAKGVFLNIHGGGFYMGSAAGSDVRNRELADTLGIVVAASTTD